MYFIDETETAAFYRYKTYTCNKYIIRRMYIVGCTKLSPKGKLFLMSTQCVNIVQIGMPEKIICRQKSYLNCGHDVNRILIQFRGFTSQYWVYMFVESRCAIFVEKTDLVLSSLCGIAPGAAGLVWGGMLHRARVGRDMHDTSVQDQDGHQTYVTAVSKLREIKNKSRLFGWPVFASSSARFPTPRPPRCY